jgi:lipoprotein-anchoring transpeptidase ErfK/SrfK
MFERFSWLSGRLRVGNSLTPAVFMRFLKNTNILGSEAQQSSRYCRLHDLLDCRASLIMTLLAVFSGVSVATARELVTFEGTYDPGTLVIHNREKSLYLVLEDGRAIRYRVAVGKPGKQWLGTAHVDGKYVEPAWSPPRSVRRDRPHLPDIIPGGTPENPMGARALTLNRGEYAIHGTAPTMRTSIGRAASYGCIRMLNEDIIDLYARVKIGTPVLAVE